MRPIDSQAKIRAAVLELDCTATYARFREWEKAGYPGAAFGDGRGSAMTPCPVGETRDDDMWESDPKPVGSVPFNLPNRTVTGPADPTDREIRDDRMLYEASLRHMATAAQTALGIQHKYLNARTTEAEKLKALKTLPGSGPCGNALCDHLCSGTGNDRLRKADRRPGDDPLKELIARCQACDQHFRRHGTERNARAAVTSNQKAG